MNEAVTRLRELKLKRKDGNILGAEIAELEKLEALVGKRTVLCARYYNSGSVAVAIVAVVTECVDWACYMGGNLCTQHKQDCVEEVTRFGDKMCKADALYFFPHIHLPYRA